MRKFFLFAIINFVMVNTGFAQITAHSKREVPVAILIPLSGKYQALGLSLQKTAQIALFDIAEQNQQIKLYFFDSGESLDSATEALHQALEIAPEVIIGPIFSEQTKLLLQMIRGMNIPLISLSNDKTLAGPNNLTLGIHPLNYPAVIMNYLAESGINKISLLSPSTKIGYEITSDIKALSGKVFRIGSIEYYANNHHGIDGSVNRVLASATKMISTKNEADKAAILLLDGSARSIITVANLFKDNRQNNNVSLIIVSPTDYSNSDLLNDVAVNGVIFAGHNIDLSTNFEQEFYEANKSFPKQINFLLYDAINMIGAIIVDEKRISRSDFIGGTYNGLASEFYFLKDGTSVHRLTILEIRDGKIRKI